MLALWLRYAPQWNFVPWYISSWNHHCIFSHALHPKVQWWFHEETYQGTKFNLTPPGSGKTWNENNEIIGLSEECRVSCVWHLYRQGCQIALPPPSISSSLHCTCWRVGKCNAGKRRWRNVTAERSQNSKAQIWQPWHLLTFDRSHVLLLGRTMFALYRHRHWKNEKVWHYYYFLLFNIQGKCLQGLLQFRWCMI